MADKILKGRITVKQDISANWEKAVNFVPLAGEIISYSDLDMIKVGDGATYLKDLAFIGEPATLITRIERLEDRLSELENSL